MFERSAEMDAAYTSERRVSEEPTTFASTQRRATFGAVVRDELELLEREQVDR